MDMDLQNQLHKDTSTLELGGSTHIPLVQSHEPKVRKPYTISKQREKWTDEEHHKFLDALKLYGRAWRQIQEFIGTKTAVQIRSHAQKFFSKVVQGGNDNIESHVANIEIPPPRPKRKPAHPYPRKYVDPQSVVVSLSFQPEKRICSSSGNANSENRSPDSVLSAAMTETLELPVSELHDSCFSNSSCSTGTQSGNLFSVDGEDNSNAMNRCASSTVENSANMHIRSPEKEADLPEATIKLFGQIVSTNDSKRPSIDGNETSVPSEKHSPVHAENKYGKLEESPSSNVTDAQLSQALYYSNWMPWPMHDVNSDSTCASLQCMSIHLYTGVPPPYLISYSQNLNNRSPFVGERRIGKELCSSSIQNNSTEETKDGVYASSPKRINKSGFVPYKRCSASTQGPVVSATTNAEEDDAQRVRLCH